MTDEEIQVLLDRLRSTELALERERTEFSDRIKMMGIALEETNAKLAVAHNQARKSLDEQRQETRELERQVVKLKAELKRLKAEAAKPKRRINAPGWARLVGA